MDLVPTLRTRLKILFFNFINSTQKHYHRTTVRTYPGYTRVVPTFEPGVQGAGVDSLPSLVFLSYSSWYSSWYSSDYNTLHPQFDVYDRSIFFYSVSFHHL